MSARVHELSASQLIGLRRSPSHVPSAYMLMFRASWCGHCKVAFPEFKKAAKKAPVPFYSVEEDAIKEINSDALRNMGFDVKGYPTFYLVLLGGQVVKFEGDRDAESILQFVEEQQ